MGRSFAEASEGVGVFVHDSCGGSVDAVVVLASGDELSDGSACGFLHGNAFGVSTCAECRLFAVGEAECHSHASLVQFDTAPNCRSALAVLCA